MKRMVSLISEQVLPNFIPLNEPATKPDVLHGIFTPTDANMVRRWDALKNVIAARFPHLRTEDVPIKDAYDAQAIQEQCSSLIEAHPDDDWALNMTGGTKLMSAPAVEVFHRNGLKVYYVESPKNRTLEIHPDWTITPIAFTESLDIEAYFRLHGHQIAFGAPRTGQEAQVIRELDKLNWQVWSSVTLKHGEQDLTEYDAIGIRFYQCLAFECKRLSDWRGERAREAILIDLLTLYQAQRSFGGPFGKSYWVFSGKHKLTSLEEERIRLFGITLIQGRDISRIAKEPARFGLPELRTRLSVAKS